MKKRMLLMLILPLFLSGCLLSINHPFLGPDGTAAVFLGESGEFGLIIDQGILHLLREGDFIPLPLTAGPGAGAVLDWHPGSNEVLYVRTEVGEWLETISSTLYRVVADPEAEPEVVYTSEMTIRDAAFRADGMLILLESGDDVTGGLSLFDPVSGNNNKISDNIVGFRQDASREMLFMFVAEERDVVAIGTIGPWEPEAKNSEPLAVFTLTEGMLESLFMIDDDFFWDVDPEGRHVAISLYDRAILLPQADEEVPTLLFIEDGESLRQIADVGYLPVFSPDGRYLAYIGSTDGETGQAMLLDPRSWEIHPVPATQGASTCFWLADDQLGVAFEADDDQYRMMVYNFNTREFSLLVE